MRKILLIGMGPGGADFLTMQAIEALDRARVFFLPDKGAEKAELREVREQICRRYITQPDARFVTVDIPQRDAAADDYRATVDDWHARIAARYRQILIDELPEDGCGAFLVWGDPTLYDSSLRILDRLRADGLPIDYEIIPGISAVQALAARHRIALNRIGESVVITTGRKLGAARRVADDTVVMLDGDETFAKIDPTGLDIYWGAYLGMKDEILIAGRLADVASAIQRARREARESKGWIMDAYLLRRADGDV
ncbi:precorrin-6A synthase (deacetylating) [Rhodopseudomonas palustris HaA2]|uniref:Precorrin-6A synthase [deacetylating] n=1 Tax=Rhodopseudomonas palustris (strain HaA2) TaxID=316058 RepID=Q2IV90_RHOP2|nr:precorrin-6A synthase (deacetylating) [Rhodopseudomonas palustris]ABD07870.1 precorrin-6A synthase (deacetylating) [Rhodopseudomonas palustris HaA2]